MSIKRYKKGIRNDYRHGMPYTEVFMKDLKESLGDLKHWIANGFKLPVVVVWPDYPSKRTTIHKISNYLGCRLTNHLVPDPALVLFFDDATTGSSALLLEKYPKKKILNARCTDISKVKVDKVHQDVFGYNTFVDPADYHGEAVVKSDVNALHDGRIIVCPVATREKDDKVYQVLIDNSFDDQYVLDYRVPVVMGRIPHVYLKYKRREVRFTNEVTYSELKNTDDFFTADEQERIRKFASQMGAEFCELDVLRNKTDGRIYVIDVNKTPYGPPFGLKQEDAEKAIVNLSSLLAAEIKASL
jgi:hypothetical protein